ncbi:hypothetical protein [Niallia circulans]|uniref:hypothetical protein n=1 Tax=Niallia circulans TaxID=1397 RepID=UPI0015617096|nr:hypothetical protein [Niallia circulans]NRG30690.1 hypothetical protein [Niallia circulans]
MMIKLEIKTHSGEVYRSEVVEYDPVQINADINNNSIITVLFGDVIISRIDVKSVVKVEE